MYNSLSTYKEIFLSISYNITQQKNENNYFCFVDEKTETQTVYGTYPKTQSYSLVEERRTPRQHHSEAMSLSTTLLCCSTCADSNCNNRCHGITVCLALLQAI